MKLADKWVHPTMFTGDWPSWTGFTFLQWDAKNKVYHPADDYNLNYGNQDLGQAVKCCANGIVIHASKSSKYYGNIVVIKHQLGYNLKRFIKQTYGIDTDVLYSFYAHLQDFIVAVGNEIDGDALIGHVGKSGNTTSAHLHFEIYAPIGELEKKEWRFYPSGWPEEKVKQFWLPPYKFIEASKQLAELGEQFLGKSKEYWLQVEEDRKSLLTQIGEVDKRWAKKLEERETEIGRLTEESAKLSVEVENADKKHKKEVEDLTVKIKNLEDKFAKAESRLAELLAAQTKDYTFREILKILFGRIKGR